MIECATGLPPNTRTEPGRRLGGILGRAPPRLNDEKFSAGLRELIAFVLEPKAVERPSMADVLEQPYVIGTETDFPTHSLSDLVKTYYQWEFSGGKRQSLFYQGGAAAAEHPGTLQDGEEWVFSTTAGFAQQVDGEDLVPKAQTITNADANTPTSSKQSTIFPPQSTSSDLTIRASKDLSVSALPRPSFTSTSQDSSTSLPPSSSFESLYPSDDFNRYFSSDTLTLAHTFSMDNSQGSKMIREDDMSAHNVSTFSLQDNDESLRHEEHVRRGEKALGGLFDQGKASYKYDVKNDFEDDLDYIKRTGGARRPGSDLPLRSTSNESEVHHEVEYGNHSGVPYEVPRIDLSTANTIRARRANEKSINDPPRANDDKAAMLGWKFPEINVSDADTPASKAEPKRATMDWKFPTMDPKPTPAPSRPALKHSTTAPVGNVMPSMFPVNPHQSMAVLDLDALYDSDTFSPTPNPMFAPTSQPMSHADQFSRSRGLPYEPNESFADDPTSPEEDFPYDEPRSSKSAAVRPPASPVWPSSPEDTPETRPRPLSKRAAKRAAAAAHNAAAKAAAVGPSSFAGPSSAGHVTGPASLLSASVGTRGTTSVFDNIMPPSAEAMAPGASPEVIANELTRLLTQFRDGLGEVGRAFAEVDADGDYGLSSDEYDEEEMEREERGAN